MGEEVRSLSDRMIAISIALLLLAAISASVFLIYFVSYSLGGQ